MGLFSKKKISALTSISINASDERVWQTLSDLKTFSEWNTRTHFKASPALNKKLSMRVKLFGLWLSVPVKIQTLDSKEGVRWQGGIPYVYTGSHYFKIERAQKGQVRFVQGEDFDGLLVPLLWPVLKKELHALYEGMNQEIKARCEKV